MVWYRILMYLLFKEVTLLRLKMVENAVLDVISLSLLVKNKIKE